MSICLPRSKLRRRSSPSRVKPSLAPSASAASLSGSVVISIRTRLQVSNAQRQAAPIAARLYGDTSLELASLISELSGVKRALDKPTDAVLLLESTDQAAVDQAQTGAGDLLEVGVVSHAVRVRPVTHFIRWIIDVYEFGVQRRVAEVAFAIVVVLDEVVHHVPFPDDLCACFFHRYLIV